MATWVLWPINASGFLMSTLENEVLIHKCNPLHNSESQQGFQHKDGLRLIWNRVQQMDSTIIDLVLGPRGGTPAKNRTSSVTRAPWVMRWLGEGFLPQQEVKCVVYSDGNLTGMFCLCVSKINLKTYHYETIKALILLFGCSYAESVSIALLKVL